jgi:hypothetical protein
MGDGVTLYFQFDTHTRTVDARTTIFRNVEALVKELQLRLKADGVDRKVSILLQMADFSGSDSRYRLEELRTAILDADYVLVLLDDKEVASESRKTLRAEIEDLFQDAVDERSVLRKLMPIMDPAAQPAKDDSAEVKNDLVYLEDNFGGAGFLPVPLAATDSALSAIILDVFADNSDDPITSRVRILQPDSALCSVICPNGWLFFLGLEFFLLVGIVSGILWGALVDVRIFLAERSFLIWIWAALTFLIGALLYLCDKSFEGIRDEFLVVFLLTAVLAAWIKRVRSRRESEYP